LDSDAVAILDASDRSAVNAFRLVLKLTQVVQQIPERLRWIGVRPLRVPSEHLDRSGDRRAKLSQVFVRRRRVATLRLLQGSLGKGRDPMGELHPRLPLGAE